MDSQLAMKYRQMAQPTLKELPFQLNYPGYDYCQEKKDGWFAAVVIENNVGYIINSGGVVRDRFSCKGKGHSFFIAEWMFGRPGIRDGEAGKLFVHDAMKIGEENYSRCGYSERWSAAEHFIAEADTNKMIMLPYYPLSEIQRVYDQSYEGIVVKKEHSPAGAQCDIIKVKKTSEEDVVCCGMSEGGGKHKGRLGNLTGYYFLNGKKIYLTTGGGFTDYQRQEIWNNKESCLGQVFRIYGKIRLPSGLIQHPQFGGWREDKTADECRKITTPEGLKSERL